MLSIVIPTLNEAPTIGASLEVLAPFRRQGVEVVVVDGGSSDGTLEAAALLADRVDVAPRGRASQMNRGARIARGDILLFLHADTALPASAPDLVVRALAGPVNQWGRFDAHIDSPRPLLRLVARSMNLRSRLTGIATGDQAIFVRRSAFEQVGGYPNIPLMEDIALSRALKSIDRPVCLRAKVVTSGRRWEKHGIVRTILLMWRLRLEFFLGADPVRLAERYGYAPRV